MRLETVLKLKMIFESQRKAILESRSEMTDDFQIQRDDLPDEYDFASMDLQQAMQIRLRQREAHLLQKIEDALARIQEGTFGKCDCCDEEIEPGRLEARPTATLCLSCKEAEETQERQFIERSGSLTKLKLARFG